MNLNKTELIKLSAKDITKPLPDLKNAFASKTTVISDWIIDWIKESLSSGIAQEQNLLPKKEEFAYLLGVSVGTIQNALRMVEDRGFVESKQRIGTIIKNPKNTTNPIRKLTSKRDNCIVMIKKYILDNKMKQGEKMPSSRVLANIIGASANTTRLALENLCFNGILEHDNKNSKESMLTVKTPNFRLERGSNSLDNTTLVEKVSLDLEKYITKNLKVGDKFPAHEKLSKQLQVSIKTIHDAIKVLIKKDILLARRGRYGTTVIKMPNEKSFSKRKEDLIFAPAKDTAFYNYEKTQNHIKSLIAKDYTIGSKLPSLMELSKQLDLSPNTIRKALNNLADEGYLRFARGRYGGTFVMDIPDMSAQSFKWLAVNPKYLEAYKDKEFTMNN